MNWFRRIFTLFPLALVLLSSCSALSAALKTYEIGANANVTYNGIASADVLGRDVAIGDVNNDGIPDLIMGARQADPEGRTNAGSVYIYLGPVQSTGTVEISAGADITVNGINPGDEAGIGVGVADINHDGIPDLIIGARYASPNGNYQSGQAYVIFGPLQRGVYELATAANITVNGIAPGDELGVGVAGGDLNQDGYADLIVGARHADPNGVVNGGETYVLYGPLAAGTYNLPDAANVRIQGVERDEKSGYGLDVGDVNGDHIPDLIVGAWSKNANGNIDSGAAYIFFGPLRPGNIQVTSADITINGQYADDHLGVDAALGDINGDGIADIMLGATEADPPSRDRGGKAFVIYGPLKAGTYGVSAIASEVWYGENAGDYFGIGLAVGDINGDGIADRAFGAFRADPDPTRVNAGQVYVVYGTPASALQPRKRR